MNDGRSPVRIAIIGISGYGRIHLELARECHDRGEAQIVAAVVINPQEEEENLARLRERKCEIYSDYQEMFRRHAGEIDLCLIPTGIPWHAPMTVAALRAGADVLVEKPLASSLREVAEIQEAERLSGRTVAVGFQDFYDPGTSWLVKNLRAGAIGKIQSVRFLGIWPRSRAYFERNNWAGRLYVNGDAVFDSPLNNAFAHFVMLSLLFAEDEPASGTIFPESVELFRAHQIESFDTAVVNLKTASGVHLWFGASLASTHALEPEIIVEGSNGSACWRYEQEAVLSINGAEVQCRAIPDQHATRREMMVAILKRLRDPKVPVCTSQIASRHTEVIEKIHQGSVITTFPREAVVWTADTGPAGALPDVVGLNTALRHSFASRQTLRGIGFPGSDFARLEKSTSVPLTK